MPTNYSSHRGTDETFYQLMQLSGSGLLKLLGFPPEIAEHYTFRAVELKEKRLRPDVEGLPALEVANERIFIEFQGYVDKFMRYRLLGNLIQACVQSRDEKPIIGIIIYTQEAYQQAALPLHQLIDGLNNPLREIVLTHYTEAQLIEADPRLIVLAPFTVSPQTDTTTLTIKAQQWVKAIHQTYPADQQAEAVNIIGLFLFSCFKKLNRQEVLNMLNLDLVNTVAGQEVLQLGRAEGKLEGKIEGKIEGRIETARLFLIEALQMRFSSITPSVLEKIQAINSPEHIEHLFKFAMRCQDLNEFERQLRLN
ncbi:hypothetical protein BegalDRAFT_2760 [Beggiatoa alba B18LD]|uniref:DUF4351 domain-containing protein n=1 Tax=Beggiatoa alba B18LD TaxID=395493 RepID=I3CJ02_9GAMM|nr:DUF2887 domain-containing protein [Beggiatoa alba]EIJ43595.1 hypothetical protein BegalDRAFT_2760 [Beggiatoa alba B18LD]